MTMQTVDPNYLNRKARQIKARIPILLSQWGLVPKFKRWRLAEDPATGMVVLFGELDSKYIVAHTTTSFNDYFDLRLLRDMETDLQVQVISSNNEKEIPNPLYHPNIPPGQEVEYNPKYLLSPQIPVGTDQEGLRYAFILKGGQPPITRDATAIASTLPSETPENDEYSPLIGDHTLLQQRLIKFLKITKALQFTNKNSAQPLPDVLLMDAAEFNQQMTNYNLNRNNNNLQMA